MRMRRTAAVVAMAAAVTVSTVATGVVAYAQSSSSSAAVSAAKKPAATPSPTRSTGKDKGRKVVKVAFSATGTVTAVDAAKGAVTVAVKSGTKDVKGRTVTITVPAGARIILNGKVVKVGSLAAGHKLTVTGTRADAVYTAARIQAVGKTVKPAPTASPSPSASSTPEPTVAPTQAPTETPEPDESEDGPDHD